MSQADGSRITILRPDSDPGASASDAPLEQHANGGAYEGAETHSRELQSWRSPVQSADREILPDKLISDARGRSLTRNSGLVSGAVAIHRDSIVGAQFRLNAKPDYKVLGLDETWAEEFQEEVESKFTLYAESNDNWLDAQRMNTLTSMIRLMIAGFVPTGEVLASVEWIKERGRPFHTAIQLIDPDRLSNPNDSADDHRMRRGIERDRRGAPQAYHIRESHPTDYTLNGSNTYSWKRVPRYTPWGRLQMIHIIEQQRPDQTRGIAEMVSVLKEMKMTKKFHDITLQNAVVNASYAAAIESELPPEAAFESIGAYATGGNPRLDYIAQLLAAQADYFSASRNLDIDGVKIPHLFPGSKLKLLPMGTPGGAGSAFEESLLRHTAAGLGLSYEQFSRDYTKTNYSSARASGNETWKFMRSRKKAVADRAAGAIYALWLEEAINAGEITSMPANAPNFYDKQNKDAYCKCTWIGASRGQVDELKETQAAILRINAGLSTLEKECASLGEDFREVFEQRAREQKLAKSLGLTLGGEATKPGTMSSQRGTSDDEDTATTTNEDDADA
jgi:lambda family phage portal protein